jgi:spermidine synthase/MFS family permease
LFYLIFFAGGLPALIYQVTWQRVLTLYFGVDIYSTTVTVATFMLGLGVGSLLGGWLADRVAKPALHYAGLEVLMGGFGLASLPMFAWIGQRFAGGSPAVVIVADFLLLLVPTTLMGMTLPLMSRVVIGSDSVIGRHLAWLYGVNTFGAALGALLSSYLLIGLFGLDGSTRLAASLNLLLAVVVYAVTASERRRRGTQPPQPEGDPRPTSAPVLGYRWVLAFSCLSGFIALGYEIVWYRVLGILLHGTVYVFGTVLFFFLAGIGTGSLLSRKHIDRGRCIDRFVLSQLGISAYAFVLFTILGHFSWLPVARQLIAASFFTTLHPSPELIAGSTDIFSLYSLVDIAGWAVLILGVPTVLMGYGFANLLREGAQHVDRLGHAIAGIYFANIVGSTAGSLAIGFWIIHYFGSEHALRMLIVAGALVPILLSIATPRRDSGSQAATVFPGRRRVYVSAALVVLVLSTFPGRTDILRAIHFADHESVEFAGMEDRTGVSVLRRQQQVIAFSQEAAVLGQQRLYIDGSHHGDASDAALAEDWPLQVALAGHPAPRRVLCIGLGDGQMAATAVHWRDVEELVIVELNGTLEHVVSRTGLGKALLTSEKTRYVVDDGRRWLLAHPEEKFDVILMFPLHAAHAFSGALYSLEFFGILADHLTDGGLLFLRTVDLYSTAKTLATVFPHVLRVDSTVYIAGSREFRFDESRLPSSAAETVPHFTADRDVILANTQAARINTDLRPNSEYYVTYPFVSSLQTRGTVPGAYKAKNKDRFWRLMVAAGTEGQ